MQTTSNSITIWSISLFLLPKSRSGNQKYNRRTFEVWIRNSSTLKKLHVCTLQNLAMYREVFPYLLICLLSVALGATPCYVQRVHFWYLKWAYFLEMQWGLLLFVYREPGRIIDTMANRWMCRFTRGTDVEKPCEGPLRMPKTSKKWPRMSSHWRLPCLFPNLVGVLVAQLVSRHSCVADSFFFRASPSRLSPGCNTLLSLTDCRWWFDFRRFARKLQVVTKKNKIFPNLALPRVDSLSGLVSQTWYHILGSHKGQFLCHMLTSLKAVSSTVARTMRAWSVSNANKPASWPPKQDLKNK